MLILGSAFAIFAFVLLFVAITVPRRLSFPLKYLLVETPLDGLKDDEVATVGEWTRGVEALGFRRAGEYSVRLDHGPAGNFLQIEKFRVWLSADGRSWAAVKHESQFDHTGVGIARAWLSLIFLSRSEQGDLFCTHNKALDDGFERHPKTSTRRHPDIQDPATLFRVHEAHVARAGTLVVQEPTGFPDYVAASWELKASWMKEHGYFRIEGEKFKPTLKLGLVSGLHGWNPFRLENGSRLGILVKLVFFTAACGTLTVVMQKRLHGEPFEYALCGLGLAWGVVGPLVFPRLSFMSWFYVVMPGLAWLQIRTGYNGWAPMVSFLGTLLTGSGMERLRYRGAAKRLDAATPDQPRLGPTGRALLPVGLLAGAVYSALAHLVMRAPQPADCGGFLLLLGLFLMGLGFAAGLLLWTALSLFPACKRWKAYPAIRAFGWCSLLGLAGFLSVAHFQAQDQAVSSERAGQIQSALEEYRKAEGRYPATLTILVPKYLLEVPAARAGWTPVPFEYTTAPTPNPQMYWLHYRSASGEKTFDPPGGMPPEREEDD